MSDTLSTLARDLVDEITRTASLDGRLISDRALIKDLSLTDRVTLEARGTDSVLTDHDSPAFISRITSRSAPFTEVFFGAPDDRQQRILRAAAGYLLEQKPELLAMDKLLGLHEEHRHHCRTIVTKPYARLLAMWDKLIFDLGPDMVDDPPDQVQIMIPEWQEYARKQGLPPISILVDAVNRVTFVLGSDYFGEVKKGHLRMAMYVEKVKFKNGNSGGLGVHAGGKVIRALDAATGRLEDRGALFFGLSGTGKTTLSVHHLWLDPKQGETVVIRQDDFFVLSPGGMAYGTEDNAYIKTEGLEADGQPLLYAGATGPHAILENVYVDPRKREPDFFRYDHPHVPGGQCYNGRGIVVRRELDYTDDRIDLDRVDYIFFITRRETIVPPVARLNTEQAAAFFMLGESILTSAADPTKAGLSVRSVGTNPFIVGSEGEEGDIFYDILRANPHIQCFLLNTGGFGGRDIDRSFERLDSPESLDKLRRFLKGERHEDIGKLVELTLRDGTTAQFKVSLVRYEVFHGYKRVRSRNNLKAVIEGVETGRIPGSKVELVEIEALAGQKITIPDSAAIIREIARGRVEWKQDVFWGYEVPASIPGLDLGRFDPTRYYDPAEIQLMNEALKAERITWLESFKDLDIAIKDVLK
ncbi:MAG: phosphoenolpyruvate carboxykinase (ATP) [bacterium]|nr:MAG: phosphoenolpyruvate carboxykinase (ATP) [bacterium]